MRAPWAAEKRLASVHVVWWGWAAGECCELGASDSSKAAKKVLQARAHFEEAAKAWALPLCQVSTHGLQSLLNVVQKIE
jgi:hypothetical protein